MVEYRAWYVRLLASIKTCPICGAIPKLHESMFGVHFEVGCCGKFFSTNHDDWRGVITRWNKYVDNVKPESAVCPHCNGTGEWIDRSDPEFPESNNCGYCDGSGIAQTESPD